MELDSGIRVSVVPAQSAFFAGETFSVSVTFTNTRNPSSPAKRASSHTHKRAVHSISSAPLARPPTSPVTPRTAVPPILASAREATKAKRKYERKGLIGIVSSERGVSEDKRSRAVEQRKGRFLSAALSSEDIAAAISSSRTSPLRDGSLPPNHPHARKQSVQDVHLESQLQLKELSSPALAPTGSASTSAFSLSLDTISENHPENTHQYPPRRRPPHLGLGLGAPPLAPDGRQPPHTAFSSTFAQPGTELILYAYSQLSGTVTLGGDTVQADSRAQTQALNAVRFALQKKQAIGGGRMDISSSLDSRVGEMSRRRGRGHANGHARASSLSSSLMSLLSPPAPPPHQPWTPGHKARSPSLIASLISASASSPASIGSSGESGETVDAAGEIPAETPLPTFEVQPAMLAVDLILGPGENTYSLPIPSNLPPTFRGRIVKFSYYLVIGVCRATPGPSPSSPGGRSSTSQVMRVPIRVYNHVSVAGPQKPYDLLWPVLHPPGKGQTAQVSEANANKKDGKKDGKALRSRSDVFSQSPEKMVGDPIADLRSYALRLVGSLNNPSGNGVRLPAEIDALSPTAEYERELRAKGGGELTGCREAVEILTRNMRKVSYDVNKDGVKVAVLTFTKSAYRLGETIVGVVELNELSSRARVLKLSAMLESHETLPSSLDPSSQSGKKLRKLHAEYHTSLTLSTLRTSFALDIPSDAAPAFQYACEPPRPGALPSRATTGGGGGSGGGGESYANPGGLAWTIRLCLLVGVASPHARKGVAGARLKGLVRDGPQGEWGTAWRATRGIAPLQNVNLRAARREAVREKTALSRSGSTGTDRESTAAVAGQTQPQPRGWASYLLSSLLTPGEREYHDGDEELEGDDDDDDDDSDRDEDESYLSGVRSGGGAGAGGSSWMFDEARAVCEDVGMWEEDLGGGDEGWAELRAETVECEVPIRVWPGNTAFRPMEVVFDV